MATLLVGFDSAWSPGNSGAIVATIQGDDRSWRNLGHPQIVNFSEAETLIRGWQQGYMPSTTIVLLDQPTIVKNALGQRPVENIVSASISRRYGGMQPANTRREEMFGQRAPVWSFLDSFGGPALTASATFQAGVWETYPALAIISLGWLLPDSRGTGRLPKYNPDRRKTFALADWQYVCDNAAAGFHERGLTELARWLESAAENESPRKRDQDGIDACLCLLVALYLAERTDCLVVGDDETGYIVVPYGAYGARLKAELEERCCKTKREAAQWVRVFRLERAAGREGNPPDNAAYQAVTIQPA